MKSNDLSKSDSASILPAGAKAPDFSLPADPQRRASPSDYHGRPVVLIFYPADWSPVCSNQLALYNEMDLEFEKFGAALLGISVDSSWCHAAFREHRKLDITLLSDAEPKGAVARKYGVYDAEMGMSQRALFVVDREGIIRWSHLSPIAVNPGADGIIEALEEMEKAKGA